MLVQQRQKSKIVNVTPAKMVARSVTKQMQAIGKPDEVIAYSGISLRFWRLYAQAWLVCLLFPILFIVQRYLEPARLILAVAGLLLFILIYTWFMWPHPLNRSWSRRSLFLFAGLAGLVLGLSLAYGSSFLWLFVGVSAVTGVVLPAGRAFLVVMGLTLLTLGLGVALSGGVTFVDWLQLVPLVLLVRGLGLDMVGLYRLADALRELHALRTELARQAVSDERLRLARDLHDLLGHTLSMITLKSELAGRLLETDPTRAVQEINEVEREARRAGREVRAAVAGYRQPTLGSELEAARQILAAAGIACAVEHTAGDLPTATDGVLAWAVREGVTNVVRHSRAQFCTIRITRVDSTVCAEVINDGFREQGPAGSRQTGSGLAGLTERVRGQGGQLEAGPVSTEGEPGFRLRVELPIRLERR
jgi:two-component system, NarL family, sensor histidine kinase DesK